MDLTTTTRQVDDVTIVDVSGRIVLGEASATLRNLIAVLLKTGHKRILFNLANVSYIDSSGLGQLVGAFISVRKQEGDLKLLHLNNKVHDILQITKLYTVFDVGDDEAAAVKSFARSAAGS
jgi:anti-sigma B factor antagonist